MDYGYVYCLTNKFMPHICKIGFVNKINKTSHDRAKELSSNTNCPIKFEVEFDIKVKNPYKYEKRIHKKLKHFRINTRREFFLCNPNDIIKYFYKNELIKNDDDNNDFADNYMTINKKEINKKNKTTHIKIYTCDTFTTDIYYLFIIPINIFINICYYLYVFIRFIIKFNYKF